jgi:ketosteroid isomerase-like protein
MTTLDIGKTASRCLQAWTTGDLATTRALLQNDVTFVEPMGTTEGAESYVEGVAHMSDMVRGAEQKKIVVDGDDVCIMYDLVTASDGAVPTVGWYHFRGDKIDSVRAYFDPRPLTTTSRAPRTNMPLFAASLQLCSDAAP